MKTVSGTARRGGSALLALVLALAVHGCAPGLAGHWQGTGERAEARYFQFALDLVSKTPTALWLADGGAEMRLAVCDVVQAEDGSVSFRIDPDGGAQTCQDLKTPMTFKGGFGRDVLAGAVEAADGRSMGRFRAFRLED